MSSGLKMDRADTAYAERAHELSLKNRNWLRHGIKTSAGKMDEMLLDGATIEQMAKGAYGIAKEKREEGVAVCGVRQERRGRGAGNDDP